MSQRGIFERFFDEGLAQASFLVGCDRTKQVVVIDPRRDASIYLAAARQRGAAIVAAIETHVHADFVSGARELARSGARVYTGPGADLEFEHQAVSDGEVLAVGDVTLRFLHTPGHTFEHIAILVESPGEPARLFTGDLLFVGGVGRPDLVGEAQTRQLASDLFDSLGRIMALDDDVEIHPGHGAGSLCGAGIGKDPSSTIARERVQNAMLQHTDRASFVSAVLADIPPTPPYFARMKRINKEGPPQVDPQRKLPTLRPAAAAALSADGALIIDLRTAAAFAEGHPDGAINIGHGTKIGYWAGWVVPADAPLILLADEPAHAQDASLQFHRVGLDRIEGTIAGGFEAWVGAGLSTARIEQISAAELRDQIERGANLTLVDVRSPREWQSGHVDGAINIPAGEVPTRAAELSRDNMVATICEGGYRSSLAASPVRTGRVHARDKRGRRDDRISRAHRGQKMKEQAHAELSGEVRERLDAVVHGETPARIPELVKAVLIDSMQCGSLAVPAGFRQPIEGTYARRLLHRDPSGQYTMVVMTWGPGQKTGLHDHAGIWCVECVVDGKMEVAQYDLTSENGGVFRFEQRNCVVAERGSAGCLIPPFEYHTLGNAAETPSITLHVYGGEMDHCHVFEPSADGSYRRVRKDLAYHG